MLYLNFFRFNEMNLICEHFIIFILNKQKRITVPLYLNPASSNGMKGVKGCHDLAVCHNACYIC